MTRSTPQWVGATSDAKIPSRVRSRVFERDNGTCQCGCTIKIRPGDDWQTDHIVALANGGANAESNLRTLLTAHHKEKTRADVAEKSRVYRKRIKHLGIKATKGRPMPGTRDSNIKRPFHGPPVDRRTGKPLQSRRTVERQT